MAEATSSTNDTMKARKAKPCWLAKKLYCLTIAKNLSPSYKHDKANYEKTWYNKVKLIDY